MDLFDLFSGLLSGPVGDNKDNHPDDVRRTKNNLKNAGYFDDNEDDTENPILTRQMDDGIKAFQKDKKLKVDGIMTPGGETERGLFETLTRRKADEVFGRADDENGAIGFGGNVSGTLERPKPDTGKRTGFMESFINPSAEQEAAEKDAALLPIRLAENDTSRPDPLEGKPIEYDATGRMIRDEIIIPEKNKSREHTIDTFLPRIIGDEGTKYTKGNSAPDAIDPYGESKMGISDETLKEYKDEKIRKGEKLPPDFTMDPKTVTQELARQIYDEYYYKRYNIDKIKNEIIAGHVLDSTINPSPGLTARWLQESLNNHLDERIEVDGAIGPQTRQAIEKAEEKGVLREVNNELAKRRIEYYKTRALENPRQRGFLSGWLERAESYILPPLPKSKPF